MARRRASVFLRAAEQDDAAAVSALYESPKVFGNLLQLPFPRESIWRERLASPDPDTLNLLALIDGEVVGHGFLGRPNLNARRRHVGVIGLAVHPDNQGRGIGSALLAAMIERAERWMQMIRLELEVYPDNLAAIAVYRKHGFVEEGRLRSYAFRDGQLVDVLAMARVGESPSRL